MALHEPKDVEVIEEYEDKKSNPISSGLTKIPPRAVLLVAAAIFLYLVFWSKGEVSFNYILILGAVVIGFFVLQSSAGGYFTDRKTAESLARRFIKNKQMERAIPRGDVRIAFGRLVEDEPRRHLIGVNIKESNGIFHHHVVVIDAQRRWDVLDHYDVPEGFEGWEHIYKAGGGVDRSN